MKRLEVPNLAGRHITLPAWSLMLPVDYKQKVLKIVSIVRYFLPKLSQHRREQ